MQKRNGSNPKKWYKCLFDSTKEDLNNQLTCFTVCQPLTGPWGKNTLKEIFNISVRKKKKKPKLDKLDMHLKHGIRERTFFGLSGLKVYSFGKAIYHRTWVGGYWLPEWFNARQGAFWLWFPMKISLLRENKFTEH